MFLVAVNFILQLLFLPFGQHRAWTFIGSYLMVPGTVALYVSFSISKRICRKN
jgi:hypothetical protein